MQFINREYELDFLNKKWQESQAQFIVIYGKRRVGKTELAIHFAKDKPHVYFLSEKTTPALQLKKFTESISLFYKDEFLPKEGFRDWETAFKYIAQKKKKILVIIDEFPYQVEADSAIPSTYQKAWDLYLKNSHVFLILLGSSISMMERTTLQYKAPLYGRRTGQLFIKPFQYKELKAAFPRLNFEELLSIYSMVGGTPLYLKKFSNQKWFHVLQQEILQKGQPLYEEVEFLLREELREPRSYFAILEALSLGKQKLSEIINATGFDKGVASRYLSILESLHIVKKEIPITEKMPEKSRKGIYWIEDPFFNFWFRFVFKNRSLLEGNKVKEVALKIKEKMPEFLARSYEKMAGQILQDYMITKKLNLQFESHGRWWDKDHEIDLVALNTRQNAILFAEVKWTNKPLGTNIYEQLKQKAQTVQWGEKGRKEYFALFSKSGFTPNMKKYAKQEQVLLFHGDKLLTPV